MPRIEAPAKVLVTGTSLVLVDCFPFHFGAWWQGGSGFIGSWVIRTLLDRQYTVRAAVRSPAKGESLCKIFGDSLQNFEYVVVPDIRAVGAIRLRVGCPKKIRVFLFRTVLMMKFWRVFRQYNTSRLLLPETLMVCLIFENQSRNMTITSNRTGQCCRQWYHVHSRKCN